MPENDDDYADLGCANGWTRAPDEYIVCAAKGHKKDAVELGTCYTEYSCKICRIKYRCDSSD